MIDFEHIQQAKAMREMFPDVLVDYNIVDIVFIWKSYSSYSTGYTYANMWIEPTERGVKEAFN